MDLISQAASNLVTQSEVESRIEAEPLLQHEVGWKIPKATDHALIQRTSRRNEKVSCVYLSEKGCKLISKDKYSVDRKVELFGRFVSRALCCKTYYTNGQPWWWWRAGVFAAS